VILFEHFIRRGAYSARCDNAQHEGEAHGGSVCSYAAVIMRALNCRGRVSKEVIYNVEKKCFAIDLNTRAVSWPRLGETAIEVRGCVMWRRGSVIDAFPGGFCFSVQAIFNVQAIMGGRGRCRWNGVGVSTTFKANRGRELRCTQEGSLINMK
jgi:hypothetical protein